LSGTGPRGPRPIRGFLGAALALLGIAWPHGARAGSITLHWTIDGMDREALVFAPETPAKAPVVFAFHGHGGGIPGVARSMRFPEVWPEAIVVYPQGLPTATKVDPRGRFPGWQHERGEDSDRDLKLFDAILATLHDKYRVDDDRVYATGFSNGAIFTYLLWAERGKTLAAIASCAGKPWGNVRPTLPMPALLIGGREDLLVKFRDQMDALDLVRKINSCSSPGEPCGPECTRYPSSVHAPVVEIIHPGGHVYPPWAPERIVEFFRNHPRR
jgi:polyhydroxybutyrate depolymerase